MGLRQKRLRTSFATSAESQATSAETARSKAAEAGPEEEAAGEAEEAEAVKVAGAEVEGLVETDVS